MFVVGNFLGAMASVLNFVLNAYMWIIVIRAIISWFSPDPYNPIVRLLYEVTEPLLMKIRRVVPSLFGGIDLSPIIVILAIIFLQEFLVKTLYHLARTMG